jgi:predicted metal-dependent hydrolase
MAEHLPGDVKHGIDLFNSGSYFEAHEALETAWRAEKGEIRFLYQGVLQVGIACLHIQRGNLSGAQHLLRKGIGLLEPFKQNHFSIDVLRLIEDAQALLQQVEKGLHSHTTGVLVQTFPTIHFMDGQR